MDRSEETVYTRYETHATYRNATFDEGPYGPLSSNLRALTLQDASAGDSSRDSSFRDSSFRNSTARDSSLRDSSYRDSAFRDSSYRDSAFRDSAYHTSGSQLRDSSARTSSFRDAAYHTSSSRPRALGTRASSFRDSAYHTTGSQPARTSSFRDSAYHTTGSQPGESTPRGSTMADETSLTDSTYTREATTLRGSRAFTRSEGLLDDFDLDGPGVTPGRAGGRFAGGNTALRSSGPGLYDATLRDTSLEDSIFTAPRASSYTFPDNNHNNHNNNNSSSSSSATLPRDTTTTTTAGTSAYTTPRGASYTTTSRNEAFASGNNVYAQGETEAFYDSLPSYDDAAAGGSVAGGSRPPAKGFSKRWVKTTSTIGWPVNKAANFVGAEGFWPSHMEKECMKAARILHSFTGLGFPYPPKKNAPMHPLGLSKKSMILIPTAVLSNCAGLAIFNVARAGAIHGSLAGGSGVVVARRADGTWSPPSSFLVSTIGGGFMIGLDIYDCICVLNTQDQLRAFTNPRFSLGGEMSVAFGPLGTGASLDAAVSRTARPMWTYMKSRGIWAGIQIDGTIIVTRPDCNAVFYNEKGITAKKILRGNMAWPEGGRPLYDVLRCIDDPHAYNRLVWEEEEGPDDDAAEQQQQQLEQLGYGQQQQHQQQNDAQQTGSLAGPIRSRDHKGEAKDSAEVDEDFFADDPFTDEHVATPPAAEGSSRNMTLLDGF